MLLFKDVCNCREIDWQTANGDIYMEKSISKATIDLH